MHLSFQSQYLSLYWRNISKDTADIKSSEPEAERKGIVVELQPFYTAQDWRVYEGEP